MLEICNLLIKTTSCFYVQDQLFIERSFTENRMPAIYFHFLLSLLLIFLSGTNKNRSAILLSCFPVLLGSLNTTKTANAFPFNVCTSRLARQFNSFTGLHKLSPAKNRYLEEIIYNKLRLRIKTKKTHEILTGYNITIRVHYKMTTVSPIYLYVEKYNEN